MKRYLFLLLICILVFHYSRASHIAPKINEKAQQTFSMLFGDVQNITWSFDKNGAYAGFQAANGVLTKTRFNKDGSLAFVLRYYKEETLPVFLKYKVKTKYKNYEIHGVTEVSDPQGFIYDIVLKNEKSYIYIRAGKTGELKVTKRFSRSDIQ